MALFPLTISSSQPAFPADQQELKIYFSYPSSYEFNFTSRIQYSLVFQLTNKTALLGGKSYSDAQFAQKDEKGYYIIVKAADLNNGWTKGSIYRLQLRYTQRGETSEWSTICYLKATANSADIAVEILNEIEGSILFINSPVFKGKYSNPQDLTETEARYKFELCDFMGEVIESTGWRAHEEVEETDSVVFNTALEDFTNYKVIYYIETKNGYSKSVQYSFSCSFGVLNNPELSISTENDYEEGFIKIHISSNEMMAANLMLRRTDSKSNFTKWEDYRYFQVLDEYADIDFNDYLVENGIEYQYGIQKVSRDNYRGSLIYSSIVEARYEHMFLVGNDRQLKIKFNPKVSSLKRTLQESKTDTIGSQYPFLRRGGAVNYFTFPISGLISYHIDEMEHFCNKDSLLISNSIQMPTDFDVNLTKDNIVVEREFRKQAEEFLTNGDYKFFKSPTEGVKLVGLMGVSLTPIDTVGRMLHSFQCTAYEVADSALTSCTDYEIINPGEFLEIEEMGTKDIGGTINLTVREQNQDLYALIKSKIENVQNSDVYKRKLQYLTYLRIEITNLNVVSNSGYTIQIKQEKDGNYTSFKISKELGFYELNNVIKIYGLKASAAGIGMIITYSGTCNYEAEEEQFSTSGLSGIQKFYQLYTSFSQALGNLDIFNTITENEKDNNINIYKILNFSYLRIDAQRGSQIEINGKVFTIDDSESLEFREVKITSAKMISEVLASISVVYNGIVYA